MTGLSRESAEGASRKAAYAEWTFELHVERGVDEVDEASTFYAMPPVDDAG